MTSQCRYRGRKVLLSVVFNSRAKFFSSHIKMTALVDESDFGRLIFNRISLWWLQNFIKCTTPSKNSFLVCVNLYLIEIPLTTDIAVPTLCLKASFA